MNNGFAKNLNELRKENGFSRVELSLKLGVSTRLISYWENGKRECDFNILIKIANLFSVSIDFLLGRVEY